MQRYDLEGRMEEHHEIYVAGAVNDPDDPRHGWE